MIYIKKHLLNLNSGKIIRELDFGYEFYSHPEFNYGVEFVCKSDNNANDKIALINKQFEFLTGYDFDDAGRFSEGLAAVEISDKWGYINANGLFEIEPQFKAAKEFLNGLAKVQDLKTKKWGYVDKTGMFIFGLYDIVGAFSDGLVYAKNKKSKSLCYFNDKGENVLTLKKPFKFLHANYSDNFAIIYDQNDKMNKTAASCMPHYLSNFGFKMLDNGFYDEYTLDIGKYHDGLCTFIEYIQNTVKVGFYDKTGKIAIPAHFDFASHFYNGIALFSNGNNIYDCKSGIITKNGEVIEIGDFYWACVLEQGANDKLFPIRANKRNGIPNANGKYGLVDKTGQIAVEPTFDRMDRFANGMIRIGKGYLKGFINDNGVYVIPAAYDKAYDFDKDGFCNAIIDDKRGLIDKQGKVIIPIEFKDIEVLTCDRFAVTTSDGILLMNDCNKLVTEKKFYSIEYLLDDIALVDLYSDKKKLELYSKLLAKGVYSYYYKYTDEDPNQLSYIGLIRKDGTKLTKEIFECIIGYSNGYIMAGDSIMFDYINTDGLPVLYNFWSSCKLFIDGVACIATHDFGLWTCTIGIEDIVRNVDNIETFFMNKLGDIVNLDTKQQHEYFRKYKKLRTLQNRLGEQWYEQHRQTIKS